MKDNWGDKIKVSVPWEGDNVCVIFKTDAQSIPMILTPEKARRLARKIDRAASAIEIRNRDLNGYMA